MRLIKFRGKRLDNKEWAYGYYVEDGFIYICSHNEDGFLQYNIVDPATVGQFTGLRDRNGKEIYEGDILTGGVSVKWDTPRCRFIKDMHDGILTRFSGLDETSKIYSTILGNIHDTPELLNPIDK